ncbi:hypothetical protein MKQ68_18785 [Chitinophaga horti]|uniref:Uncharacterized protein n=1 Tax=Chitinophaga horti TaxID=2920382 RepID=A0ABY6J0H1_9BACT|nr:hypothetical protein [Chitinophaga horti]UYQ92137.1 hypothetical protein MKQ68_18785 [Chitinophaga horti]
MVTYYERSADTIAIEYGAGEYLMDFHEHHNKLCKRYKASEGLTTNEIRMKIKAQAQLNKAEF